LIDCHIHGRIVLGIECRSHPRIDPPIAGRSASLGPKGVSPGGIPPVNWFPDSFPDRFADSFLDSFPDSILDSHPDTFLEWFVD